MFAYGIFEVLYAPQKALKEAVQNPRYVGPILVMILFVIANMGFGYALLSKTYLDQTMPISADKDEWTETLAYWTSNANITYNYQEFISGIYYGNKSLEFNLNSSSHIWMELNITEPLNCSEPEGYKKLTFRVNIVKPASPPSNVSIYLFSSTRKDSFYKNITGKIDNTGIWNNLTFSLGQEWTQINDADWGNITGLKLEFTWSDRSNVTLLIDGLFFHGVYKSGMEIAGDLLVSLGNPYSPINAFMQFTIQWVLLGGVLYIIPKMFGVKTVWKPLLVAAGFILMAYFIRTVVFTFVYTASPEIYYTLAYLGGVPGEWEKAYEQVFQKSSLPYQVLWGFDKLVWVWAIALCAITIRIVSEMSWAKSFVASTSSYLLYTLLLLFLAPTAVFL